MEPDGPGAGAEHDGASLRVALWAALRAARRFLGRTLDIRRDANIEGTIETIHKDMVFAGPNVWVLVCSIFIASIGLNTNSAAVIIGAMLISPLMGPILAVGLSVGVNDLPTLRRAVKNFVVMMLVALVTSTLYFLITPLGDVQSELLARTRPTLLDAAIALFGGVAGIVGVSRRDRGNVIPGVAIATALMPPLCTAGFGLANANWPFFFGAIYLFALNSIFIATATVAVVRFLHFPFVEFIDDAARRRVRVRIAVFVTLILIPSAWLMVGVVKESLFRRRANDFIAQNLGGLPGVDIVNQRIVYGDTLSTIEVFLAGSGLPPMLRQQLESRMAAAGLANTRLRLHQPQDLAGELGRLSGELRVGIVQDLYERQAATLSERERRIAELEATIAGFTRDTVPVEQITREVAVQYPSVETLAFGKVVQASPRVAENGGAPLYVVDTVTTVLVGWRSGSTRAQRAQDQARLAEWLKVRLQRDTVRVIGN
ncbi:MAG: membrane protein [Gemmatimonadota bacterium]